MKHLIATLLIFSAVLSSIKAETVTVFAAASLADSLKLIAADYKRLYGDKIVFNFAASGTLARQIESGAPADLFFSADEAKANALESKNLLVKETRKSLLLNTLVIVAPSERALISSPSELTNAAFQRLALGDLKIVPAGTYAKMYFQTNALWPAIEPKVIPCENVRAVLAAVESGNVDAGIVYKTDAAISKKVKVLFEIPAADGPKISYPAALLANGPQPKAAEKFLTYLSGTNAKSVFARYGFIVDR